MKIIKLRKKHYDPYELIKDMAKLLLFTEEEKLRVCLPSYVYISKQDEQKTYLAVKALAERDYGKLNKKDLKLVTGMYNLNYSANSMLASVLKPGYAVVDDRAILEELNKGRT